tara:strand:+ start:18046 stop:18927 length:882 start_codon:yes stop_codon:yes gene_type:complete
MKIIKELKRKGLDIEWVCLKIPLIYYWLGIFRFCLSQNYKAPIPLGICKIINCSVFLEGYGLKFMMVASAILCIMYLFDIKMKWTTLGLFCLSIILFTSEESSGVLNRNGILSFLFLSQAFAYWFNGSNLNKLKYSRIQYSIQAIIVGYFLSACSKLLDSGLCWANDGFRITLQVLKSFHYNYYTTLNGSELLKADEIVHFLSEYQNVLIGLLIFSLMLEFFALTAAINRGYARVYGIALLFMHIGIYFFMDIIIISFVVPMVFVLINPLFLAVLLYNKIFRKPILPLTFKPR